MRVRNEEREEVRDRERKGERQREIGKIKKEKV
jgi:hypothetical protein